MVDALKQSGKSVDYLLASEEAHGFSNPESEMAVYRAIEVFLHEHLGGKIGHPPRESISQRLIKFRENAKSKNALAELPKINHSSSNCQKSNPE
jgi:hypothetical protein